MTEDPPRARPAAHRGSSPSRSGSRSARPSARSRASSSPTSACRPSSSRSVACCPPRARLGPLEREHPGRASTRPSSCSVVGRPDRSASTMEAGASGSAISAGIVGLLVYNRRRRRKFGFAVRPMWAEFLLGATGINRERSDWVAIRQQQPAGRAALAQRYAKRARHHASARWPADPGRHPVAARHRPHRHVGDDVRRYPTPVRPIRLRVWRQPRGGRAGRHQHALDHPQGRTS